MGIIALRRKHVQWNIEQNPTTITIHRTEKANIDGHFNENDYSVGPFTVRIFTQGNRMPQEVSTMAGTKQIDKGWGMLADYLSDIKAGPNVKDEFNVTGMGSFLIKAVYPQMVKGQVVGYQADLEKVI